MCVSFRVRISFATNKLSLILHFFTLLKINLQMELNIKCWSSSGQQVSHYRWNLRNPLNPGVKARDPTWFYNPGQTSPEVQIINISGPHKKDCCPSKFFFKENPTRVCKYNRVEETEFRPVDGHVSQSGNELQCTGDEIVTPADVDALFGRYGDTFCKTNSATTV